MKDLNKIHRTNGQLWIDKNSPYRLKYHINNETYIVTVDSEYEMQSNLYAGQVVSIVSCEKEGVKIPTAKLAQFPDDIENVVGLISQTTTSGKSTPLVKSGIIKLNKDELEHTFVDLDEYISATYSDKSYLVGAPVYWFIGRTYKQDYYFSTEDTSIKEGKTYYIRNTDGTYSIVPTSELKDTDLPNYYEKIDYTYKDSSETNYQGRLTLSTPSGKKWKLLGTEIVDSSLNVGYDNLPIIGNIISANCDEDYVKDSTITEFDINRETDKELYIVNTSGSGYKPIPYYYYANVYFRTLDESVIPGKTYYKKSDSGTSYIAVEVPPTINPKEYSPKLYNLITYEYFDSDGNKLQGYVVGDEILDPMNVYVKNETTQVLQRVRPIIEEGITYYTMSIKFISMEIHVNFSKFDSSLEWNWPYLNAVNCGTLGPEQTVNPVEIRHGLFPFNERDINSNMKYTIQPRNYCDIVALNVDDDTEYIINAGVDNYYGQKDKEVASKDRRTEIYISTPETLRYRISGIINYKFDKLYKNRV